MASKQLPNYKRILIKWLPFLFRKCIDENYHWITDRYCYCCCNEYFLIDPKKQLYHNGGARDMWLNKEVPKK